MKRKKRKKEKRRRKAMIEAISNMFSVASYICCEFCHDILIECKRCKKCDPSHCKKISCDEAAIQMVIE